mmetsp:Transcript_2100/g.6414  ORF Transcript_2100/g.6414 Transcript_2100/m.6414 type:complete len:88 (+) Transcript_2100:3204-3467(+)
MWGIFFSRLPFTSLKFQIAVTFVVWRYTRFRHRNVLLEILLVSLRNALLYIFSSQLTPLFTSPQVFVYCTISLSPYLSMEALIQYVL